MKVQFSITHVPYTNSTFRGKAIVDDFVLVGRSMETAEKAEKEIRLTLGRWIEARKPIKEWEETVE